MKMKKIINHNLAFLLLSLVSFPAIATTEKLTMPEQKSVRLAVVNTPAYSGLLVHLLKGFETDTGYTVDVYSSSDVYEKARAGKADIVISHYGKHQVKSFVLEGLGSWPKMVFANQVVIIGPSNDPANIKDLDSASLALSNIAQTKSPFINNPIPGINYLTEILWEVSGKPDKTNWFINQGTIKAQAAKVAEQKNGYFIWGAEPFLKYKQKSDSKLEILVAKDPLLQRIMSATLVNPDKFENINQEGAEKLLQYLLSPTTQAKIKTFHTKDNKHQLWWPAGRDN